MTTTVKTNFTAGELSYCMLGRGDLRAYENGALFLRNVFINPTGGVSRRAGLRYIDTLSGHGRLISFAFNTEQNYMFVVMNQVIWIYMNEVKVAELETPWLEKDIPELRWTQSADTLLIAHQDYPLKKITRSSHTDWSIEDWTFYEDSGFLFQPYYKFAPDNVTLTLSELTGTITLTASASVFLPAHVGIRLAIDKGQVLITEYISPTEVTAEVQTESIFETVPEGNVTKDWKEQAFSAIRGYPIAVTFHQDRLVIGGSRDLPNRLWMSKSADLKNFNLGEGLDDESIEFGLLSDQVNAIKALFSGRHLQVFTSGAEWMVSGEPLTPMNIQLKRQTRVGSPSYAYVPPCNVDGATLFCSAHGSDIREFLFSDVEQAYQAQDLSMLSRHLINYPVDMDYDDERRLLFVVMIDGSLCTLTNYRSEQVSAWSKHETDGNFLSVSVLEKSVYVLVERDGAYFLELFDDDFHTDATLIGAADEPKSVWSGLDNLEGKTVSIIADGVSGGTKTVVDGRIELDYPAKEVSAGLPFTHIISPLPPFNLGGNGRAGNAFRLVRAVFRVLESTFLEVDVGMGIKSAMPLTFGKDFAVQKSQPVTKDIILRGIGWKREPLQPLWRVESSYPAPFSLISVTTEMKGSG